MDEQQNDQGAGTTSTEIAQPVEPDGDAVDTGVYDETFKELHPGQTVEGKVVHVGQDEVLVDVGYKSEGRIPLGELGIRGEQTPADIVSVGDSIRVVVVKIDDAEGILVISRRRIAQDEAWQRVEDAHEKGELVEGRITERVRGGLVVDVGVRGFIPASHVTRGFVENLDGFVGQTMSFQVLELDRKRRNVVLSRKPIIEEELRRAKEAVYESLKEGQVLEGTVKRLADFGAFVDIGNGVEGLLHVSEMAWTRVRHPKDVLAEGDRIKVMILGIDREHDRISLGLRQTIPNPWDKAAEKYPVGQVVTGEVTRTAEFGAFVKLEEGVEGLVHISQLANRHVAKASEVVSPGDTVKVKVLSVDPVAKRIGLSIREAEPKPERAPEIQKTAEQPAAPAAQSTVEPPITLGDLFGNLGELLKAKTQDPEEK